MRKWKVIHYQAGSECKICGGKKKLMSTDPYREHIRCLDCERRAKQDAIAAEMLPFQGWNLFCPECNSRAWHWKTKCNGGQTFSDSGPKPPWWAFWKKQTWSNIVKCRMNDAPTHFHLWCKACNHTWMMLSKSETKLRSQNDKLRSQNENDI